MIRSTTLLFASLVVAVGACHHEPKPKPVPVPKQGTLSGTVTMTGTPCADPAPGCEGPAADYEVVVMAKDGTTIVAKAKTDASGTYTIDVPSGDYTIFTPAGPTDAEKKRNDITVNSEAPAKLDLKIDTGVRAATP